MEDIENTKMLRRKFLFSSSLVFFGAGALKSFSFDSQMKPGRPVLREDLSPEELKAVSRSIMAADMENFWGKGYSCAETGLVVALRYMKMPEDLVWASAGFGGGIGHQDLCGFLTSGIMAIGIHTGALKLDKKAAKEHCGRKVNEYWDWWVSTAPLHCPDIRGEQMNFKICGRLGRLAAAKLEELLKA
jgi:hypothetical protein